MSESTHDKMMCAEGCIVAALEAHGYDPCPAIKIAQEAMEYAWDAWDEQERTIRRSGLFIAVFSVSAIIQFVILAASIYGMVTR